MTDAYINPSTPITGGAAVGASNPMPVQVVGGNVPRILGSSGTASAHTGDTSETILGTVNVPANLLGTNGGLRIVFLFSYTNSANNKTIKARWSGIGGTALFQSTQTTTASLWTGMTLWNANATGSQKAYNSNFPGFGTTGSAPFTTAIDTTAATTIVFTGQLANTGETITLESYSVEYLPAV